MPLAYFDKLPRGAQLSFPALPQESPLFPDED